MGEWALKYVRLQDTKTQVCSGSMNKLIGVYGRSLAPVDGDQTVAENFTLIRNTYAMVKQISGESIFDGSNVKIEITHEFYIRFSWTPLLTFEYWVQYYGVRNTQLVPEWYRIYNIVDYEDKHLFLQLKASKRGETDLPVNVAS